METLTMIYDYVVANWFAISAIIAALFVVAKGVAKLTKTKTDDEYVAKAESIWMKIASLFAKKK